MFRVNSLVLSAIVGILMLTPFGTAQTDIPKMISYQGKVTDSGGTPVTDGNYTMRFWIYDAATGGAILWDSGAQSVAVSGGVFNVLLGESPQPMIDLDFDQDYWLLVRFNGVDQTPRQRLASVGYAYMASGLIAGTEVIGEVTTGNRSAIKGINTDTAGYTYGIYGRSNSTRGYGVVGMASASSGMTYGVYGASSSNTGARGVYGWASASFGYNVGVYGLSSSENGRGVQGYSERTVGTTYGVFGESASTGGCGVYGEGPGIGVKGSTSSDLWYGAAAVWGEDLSGDGVGVRGHKEGTNGVGVYGNNETMYGGSGVGGISVMGYGLYGMSFERSGAYVETDREDNNYGLETDDNIYSLNYHLRGAVMHLVRNGGDESLEPNDVVVFSGMDAPLNDGGPPVVEVSKATSANSTAVAGVVYSRFNLEAVTRKSDPLTGRGSKPDREVTPEGPVPSGEYLLLVVQGPAQVKASALAGSIRPGDLLASAPEAGSGCKATELTIEGRKAAMPGSVFGKALESLEGGQRTIYAFVTLQ